MRAESPVKQAPGSHIGREGGLLPDGQVDDAFLKRKLSVSQLAHTHASPIPTFNLQKRSGLKAEANLANGGVGVTYS